MKRILVVLPNWFGETLFATPFLRGLREEQPTAFIATLGWPQCREVLLHNGGVNELIAYEEHDAHRTLAGKWRLVKALRTRSFDTAFILRRSLSRTLLLALAGIPTRVGFAHPKSGWLLTHRLPAPSNARQAGNSPLSAPTHKAFAYLPLLRAAGSSLARVTPYEYTVSEEERRDAQTWLKAAGGSDGGPVVVLHPGANWFHKRWSVERFAAVGDRLQNRRGVKIVITGGPQDVSLAKAILRTMQRPAIVLAGQTTLRQLGACIEQAHLVIANDTGVLHIAAALGKPLVALYGPTSPALTGPLGDPQRMIVLHHADCCPRIPCYSPTHPPHAGMDAITVDEVSDAALKLLSEKPS